MNVSGTVSNGAADGLYASFLNVSLPIEPANKKTSPKSLEKDLLHLSTSPGVNYNAFLDADETDREYETIGRPGAAYLLPIGSNA